MAPDRLLLGRRGQYYAYKKSGEQDRLYDVVRPNQVHDPDPQEWEAALWGDV